MRSSAKRTGVYLCGYWLNGLSAWILGEVQQQKQKVIQVELKTVKWPQVC